MNIQDTSYDKVGMPIITVGQSFASLRQLPQLRENLQLAQTEVVNARVTTEIVREQNISHAAELLSATSPAERLEAANALRDSELQAAAAFDNARQVADSIRTAEADGRVAICISAVLLCMVHTLNRIA